MDPCNDRFADAPEPRLCPDSKLSVSNVNMPSRSSGTSRFSPWLHRAAVPSIGWYLISMVTLVWNPEKEDVIHLRSIYEDEPCSPSVLNSDPGGPLARMFSKSEC